MKIILFIVLAVIFYLVAVWINVDFNALYWGTTTKIVYFLGAVITAIMLINGD